MDKNHGKNSSWIHGRRCTHRLLAAYSNCCHWTFSRHCKDYNFICAYTRVHRRRGRVANSAKTGRVGASGQDGPPQGHNALLDIDEPEQGEVEDASVSNTDGDIEAVNQPATTSSPASYQQFRQHCSAGQVEAQQTYQVTPNNLPTYSNGQYSEQLAPQDALNAQQFTAVQGGAGGLNLNSLYQEWPNGNNLHIFTREIGVTRPSANEHPSFHRRTPMNTLPPLAMNELQPRASYQYSLPPLVGVNGSDAAPYARTPHSSAMGLSTSASTPQTDNSQAYRTDAGCRYPVLLPLIRYVRSFIPTKELCNLLDLYFTEPSNSLFECASPYVLTQIVRKKSFLRKDRPRKTSAALLAAMLWVTAQTSDAQFFKISARVRSSICDQLLKVCLDLLDAKDLEERPWPSSSHICSNRDKSHCSKNKGAGNKPDEPVETVDDILTFALIGTVVSGGDTRRESMKWWASAWALAKKLELNREVDDAELHGKNQASQDASGGEQSGLPRNMLDVEEAREERRRTWWLLYIADRHLALSYNAKLNILDAECRIYQPLDETTWQDFDMKLSHDMLHRYFGPSTTIAGVGLFEYFLPLMTILGDIVEIHHLTCHPRFSLLNLGAAIAQAEDSLNIYEASLKVFEDSSMFNVQNLSSPQAMFIGHSDNHGWSVELTRQKIVIAYSKHLVHVLHILLHGGWDPMSMLDGMDQWVTPDSFVKCATHAISAATAVSEILSLDPELSFMPYLFGIYLLHGSFILLIFADRMDMSTSDTVSEACETIIRAHEVCVTTLNTEYQRNFRKVLRSALNNVRGTVTVDNEQHKNRRRELLSMFQWTKDGKGLLA
ncbi:fungal-specific transcription factor domain-containing protein [Halenospora varia]|nr:fungal-specific transcription factor domain-containing protein [Halenospora varia]